MTGMGSVGATFQLGAVFGVGRCDGIEKTSLISLTSEEGRTRPHIGANIAAAARRPRRTDLVVAFLGANVREHGRADCALAGPPTVFTFSEDTHRNARPPAVEFGVEIRPPRLFRIVESQGASRFACA